MRRRVIALNHAAAPLGAPGGTRHVELFGRLDAWDAIVIAGNRSLYTRRATFRGDDIFRPVWVAPYRANGPTRIINWASFCFTGLAAGLRYGRVDVVYASSPHLLAGLAGWFLARIRRVPLVLEIRDLWPQVLVEMGTLKETSIVYRVLRRLESFLYGQASAVVVLAGGAQRTVVSRGAAPDRVVFIPNGADPEDFVAPASRDELRRQFKLSGFVVAYTGAHGPANGLDLVINAARQLREELPGVRFVLVGDGLAKPELVRITAEERLTNVEFRDPIAKAEMPALLGAVDVGLHVLADVPLFRYGVSPNKLFDYMAAGIPVITNTAGEVAELVRRANAGLVAAPDDITDIVRSMVKAGPVQRANWGASGRSYMASSQSRRVLAKRLEDVLDEAAPEVHGSRSG
jgi:glycosyltransferase involved in cell wall biosynthesis